jgi:hypothetical protein
MAAPSKFTGAPLARESANPRGSLARLLESKLAPPSRLPVLPAPLLLHRLRDRSASASACAAASAEGRDVGSPPNFRTRHADVALWVEPWLLTELAAESRVVRLNGGGGCPGAVRDRDDARLSVPTVA